ncbi:MAG: GNAT family N-acetyltransferase [Myxococcales bacterium]|nr:GNAT family N-acetyltransferase [Myxococcales bacterium]
MLVARLLHGADVEAVCDLLGRCYRWLGDRGEYSREQALSLARTRAAPAVLREEARSETCFVAVVDSRIVGVSSVGGNELTRLYVAPEHHRSGVGSLLFRMAERTVRFRGFDELVLGTTASAVPFYVAQGVQETGVKSHGLPGFEDRQVVLMSKTPAAEAAPFRRLQVRYSGKLGKPVGVFGACHHLRRAGRLSLEDDRLFSDVDRWFKDNLPEPPFYADGNSLKAITWFKDSATEMLARTGPLTDILRRYGVEYDLVESRSVGHIIYEDAWQVGVI